MSTNTVVFYLGVAAMIGVFILLAIRSGAVTHVLGGMVTRALPASSPLTSLDYSSLGGFLTNKNILSLIVGLFLSGMIVAGGMLLAIFVVWLMFWLFLPDAHHWLISLAAAAIGALLTIGYVKPFFRAGLFTVLPGQTAYAAIFNVPILEFDVGDAWIIPRIMQYKIVDSQAIVVNTDRQQYITGNGVPVEAQTSCTAHVSDPLKFQKLREGETVPLVSRQLSTKTRAYVALQQVDMTQMSDLEKMDAAQQWEFIQRITAFKGNFVKDGPEAIRLRLNIDLADYGLAVEEGQVQVNHVSLPQTIEEAINRIYKEIFEKVGLSNDARNKVAVATIMTDLYKVYGIDFGTLGEKEKIEIIKENLDRALANEDKAKIIALHQRGNVSPTMPMINVN